MFRVTTIVIIALCFKASIEDLAHLWHCIFKHLGHKGLQMLVNKDMVRGLPKLRQPSKICTNCMKGKQHREAFPKQSLWRAPQILELVHAEICDPIKLKSHNRKRYFITSIDEFSRKTWVFSLT